MGCYMTVEKSTITPSTQLIAGRSMVEAGNCIIERANTFRPRFDHPGIAADAAQPTVYHVIVAGYHKCVI